jgi:hypothetical protein
MPHSCIKILTSSEKRMQLAPFKALFYLATTIKATQAQQNFNPSQIKNSLLSTIGNPFHFGADYLWLTIENPTYYAVLLATDQVKNNVLTNCTDVKEITDGSAVEKQEIP